jgi:hypothetical protein
VEYARAGGREGGRGGWYEGEDEDEDETGVKRCPFVDIAELGREERGINEIESARVERYYRKIFVLDEVGIAWIKQAQKLLGRRKIFIQFHTPYY